MASGAAAFDWAAFLAAWSRELIACDEIARSLPAEVRASGWLGFPGASEGQIARAEARLGKSLPPSYREFLKVSNGWLRTGFFIDRMWSTEEIDWFRVRNQEWIDDWNLGAAYYSPGPPTDPADERRDLPFVLEISDAGDAAIYLLNPNVIAADREWEAWFFSNWNPGADRYRSFAEMMQAARSSFLYARDRKG